MLSKVFIALLVSACGAASIKGPGVPGGEFSFDCMLHYTYSDETYFPVAETEVYSLIDENFDDCHNGLDASKVKGKIVLLAEWAVNAYDTLLICTGFKSLATYNGVDGGGELTWEVLKNIEDMGAAGIVIWYWGVPERLALKAPVFGDDRKVNIPVCITAPPCVYDVFDCFGANSCHQGGPETYLANVTVGRIWYDPLRIPFWLQTGCPNATMATQTVLPGVTMTLDLSPLPTHPGVQNTGTTFCFVLYGLLNCLLALYATFIAVKIVLRKALPDRVLTLVVVFF